MDGYREDSIQVVLPFDRITQRLSAKTGRGTMIVRRRPSMRAETRARDVGVYGKDCISRDNG